ncbi:MAG: hypothetical protein ACJ766_03995 [Thermoleophilaceae bacterium]
MARPPRVTGCDVRLGPAHDVEGSGAIRRLTDHADVGLVLEDHAEAGSEQLLIVRDDDPIWRSVAAGCGGSGSGGGSSSSSSSTPVGNQSSTPGVRYDGGPEEGSAFAQPPATRYDGGPEEGTAAQSVSGQR